MATGPSFELRRPKPLHGKEPHDALVTFLELTNTRIRPHVAVFERGRVQMKGNTSSLPTGVPNLVEPDIITHETDLPLVEETAFLLTNLVCFRMNRVEYLTNTTSHCLDKTSVTWVVVNR